MFPHRTSGVLGPQKGNASVGEISDQKIFFVFETFAKQIELRLNMGDHMGYLYNHDGNTWRMRDICI